MAVEAASDDPSPSISGPTRVLDLNAPSPFHEALFATQITNAAPTLRRTFPTNKSRGSLHRLDKRLSRAASTPSFRASAMSDSEQDKKRNKLGYQRISIACGEKFALPSRVRDPSYRDSLPLRQRSFC